MVKKNKKMNRIVFNALLVSGIFLMQGCGLQKNNEFVIVNPYETYKPYPYKASLHNHTGYHPEYTHATEPGVKRMKDHRDYETTPPYGIVAISDHGRITTPDNTTPPVINGNSKYPWGVDDILWIPGNESNIGNGLKGGVNGHFLLTNVSLEQTDKLHWSVNENPAAGSGWIYSSVEMPASVELSFTGTGVKWIACKDMYGGIAKVYLNDSLAGEANLYSPSEICNQVVFSIKGLVNQAYTLKIVYDRKGNSDARYMAKINVDMIAVQQPDGSETGYGADHPELFYKPYQYKHTMHPRGEGRGIEEGLKMLSEDGVFMTLPHPNSRLETSGEHAGTQLWNSSGYTFSELDSIFGNKEQGIPPLQYLPHALEIGNRGYDFSERTAYTNAEEKWDYLLKQGFRVLGIASDDTHGKVPFEGWIVVNTNAKTRSDLTIEDVMESLFSGNFYASQGPNMGISLKRKNFTITTEQPSLIEFIANGEVVHREENVTSASYKIQGDEVYVRGRVTREDEKWREVGGGIGRKRSAWTNPIYIIR